jgi:hypothetical protein
VSRPLHCYTLRFWANGLRTPLPRSTVGGCTRQALSNYRLHLCVTQNSLLSSLTMTRFPRMLQLVIPLVNSNAATHSCNQEQGYVPGDVRPVPKTSKLGTVRIRSRTFRTPRTPRVDQSLAQTLPSSLVS